MYRIELFDLSEFDREYITDHEMIIFTQENDNLVIWDKLPIIQRWLNVSFTSGLKICDEDGLVINSKSYELHQLANFQFIAPKNNVLNQIQPIKPIN